jgi:hypothetical protein
MKKIYSLNRRWLILIFILYGLNCDAQKRASPEMYTQVASQVTFIVHAPVAIMVRKDTFTRSYFRCLISVTTRKLDNWRATGRYWHQGIQYLDH